MGKPIHVAANAGFLAYPAYLGLATFTGSMAWDEALGLLVAGYTAYDPVVGAPNLGAATANYTSIIVGHLASKLAAKFGLNRYTWKGLNV